MGRNDEAAMPPFGVRIIGPAGKYTTVPSYGSTVDEQDSRLTRSARVSVPRSVRDVKKINMASTCLFILSQYISTH